MPPVKAAYFLFFIYIRFSRITPDLISLSLLQCLPQAKKTSSEEQMKEAAPAILDLATRIKASEGSEEGRRLLIRTLLAPEGHNIRTPEQLAAAVNHVKSLPAVGEDERSATRPIRSTLKTYPCPCRTQLSTRMHLEKRPASVSLSMRLPCMPALRVSVAPQ